MRSQTNKELETQKMKETTSIEISIEVYNKLHNVCEQIRKIVHKKHITPDQALSVMLATRPLEEILIDMQLEGAENHVKQR